MYRLKPNIPDFEIVDGPFAGRKYIAGEVYKEIPQEEKEKFEEISPSPQSPPIKGGEKFKKPLTLSTLAGEGKGEGEEGGKE